MNPWHKLVARQIIKDRAALLTATAEVQEHLRDCITCGGHEFECSIALELSAARNQRESALRVLLGNLPDDVSGICRECGCTDDRACNPPCTWVDAKHTLCSACDAKERSS